MRLLETLNRKKNGKFKFCLNPYSTGNEVVGNGKFKFWGFFESLNPYSTGNEVVGMSFST